MLLLCMAAFGGSKPWSADTSQWGQMLYPASFPAQTNTYLKPSQIQAVLVSKLLMTTNRDFVVILTTSLACQCALNAKANLNFVS